jgi:hypothetical protein
MKTRPNIAIGSLVVAFILTFQAMTQAVEPIKLHPGNPHYFQFRGQPTVLITSAEHYGGVVNLDFDYNIYFGELQRNGLNLTRIFTGTYVEYIGSWGNAPTATANTLAPPSGRFICPWARSATPGYLGGGNKFNLNAWDVNYFNRLKDFVSKAGQRGIVVEVSLFSTFYDWDHLWDYSPMKGSNNVNNVGNVGELAPLTLSNGGLLPYQKAMVQKIVTELKGFDNVYYEICNEPYFSGVTLDWQNQMISTIVSAEAGSPRHLIAQNFGNASLKSNLRAGIQVITGINPAVSILNFHYLDDMSAIPNNYQLNRPIANDETGNVGVGDTPYRKEAWANILGGAGVYNNLDVTFKTNAVTGTAALSSGSMMGGGPTLRGQLKILKDFIHGFDFIRMAPNNGVITGGLPAGVPARALVEVGRQYAIYLNGGSQATLGINLPAATYRADWVNTKSGAVDKTETFSHGGGSRSISSPTYAADIALRVRNIGSPTPTPTPTPTPSPSPSPSPSALAPPTIIAPSNGATVSGTSATISWTAVSGAAGYLLRCEDLTGTTPYDVRSTWKGGPFLYIDRYQSTSITTSVVAGHSYRFWISSMKSNFTYADPTTWSAAAEVRFSSKSGATTSLTFTASSDFSGTQGHRQWSYLDSTGAALVYDSVNLRWKGVEAYLWIWAGGCHPGASRDVIRRWTAPQAGVISITGNVRDIDPNGGAGVVAIIRKNGVELWRTTIVNGNSTGVNFSVPQSVAANDRIDFVVNRNGDYTCDSTELNPTVVLTPAAPTGTG